MGVPNGSLSWPQGSISGRSHWDAVDSAFVSTFYADCRWRLWLRTAMGGNGRYRTLNLSAHRAAQAAPRKPREPCTVGRLAPSRTVSNQMPSPGTTRGCFRILRSQFGRLHGNGQGPEKAESRRASLFHAVGILAAGMAGHSEPVGPAWSHRPIPICAITSSTTSAAILR